MTTSPRVTYKTKTHAAFGVLLVCLVILVPLSVHAGVFSLFFDTAAAETPEDVFYVNSDSAQDVPLLRAALRIDPNPPRGGGDIIIENGALVPTGDIDKKANTINTKTSQGEISVYIVREGDTLSQIAEMFDVSAKTILWANDIKNMSTIRPGDTLVILPITGVRHVVKQGDTIATIAKKYSGDAGDILSYNQLAEGVSLTVGDTIIVPDGTVAPVVKPKEASPSRSTGGLAATGKGSAGFKNPLPGAIKTQGAHGYNGVDLAGVPVGTPVLAAAAGDVIVAKGSGWNGGYGSYVVLRHPNGTQTLYAHLSKVNVAIGQKVKQGAVVGGMGNTGRSTGPHLHFEVRGARNPF